MAAGAKQRKDYSICISCGKGTYHNERCKTCRINETAVKVYHKNGHDKYVQRTYGMRPGEYDELLALQGGVCAICHKPNIPGKRLAVDHDHASGLVRGLLCDYCNRAIGLFREDVGRMSAAIEYLERF